MDKFFWEEEKEKRRKESLERHARLHKLFREDRLAFERERRDTVREFLDGIENEDMKRKLSQIQASWDKRMRGAGSAHNRFVLAQAFFWEHFHNVWNPCIQELNQSLNGKPRPET